MHRAPRWKKLLLAGALVGCAADIEPVAESEVAVARAALSACDEMVPANRFIDGIPAYAQCEASQNSAIYSNNGIDTSTTQVGSDWVRTQYSGGYQCTELAHRYLHFKWDVRWLPRGNAGQWCDTEPPADSGMVMTSEPVHGDLMVLAPGSCGAAQGTGHVVVIDTVDAATGRLSVVEQNRANRGSYQPTCGRCFLHVVANDGAPHGAAGGPAPAGAGGTGGMGGVDAIGGAGGMPPAGAGGSAPVTPPPVMPPAATPPPATPPVMPPATTPPPAVPSPSGQAGAAAVAQPAAAGSAADATTLPGVMIPVRMRAQDSGSAGCSVADRPGASAGGDAFRLLAMLLAVLTATRRLL